MPSELTIRHALSKQTQTKLAECKSDIRPGDVVINVHSHYDVGRVCKVLEMTAKRVTVAEWDGSQWQEHEDDGECPHTIDYDYLKEYIKYDGDPATLETDVLKTLHDVEGSLGAGFSGEISDETALAPSQGKEPLLEVERSLQAAQNRALIAQAVLAKKRDEISSIVSRFEGGLKKVRKVLHVIELYLGIDEEILMVRDGQPAPVTEPISIRQLILYMDEEYGDPTEGGLDWKNVEDFDAWVIKPGNTQRVLPEKKGVVALQVRRHMKNYGDTWANIQGDKGNSRTYLLLRNGERLYRIWMNEHIHPRLFPRKDEFKTDPDHEPWGYEAERLKNTEFAYKKYGVMLQGLIARTEVFQPLPHAIDLFRPDTWEGLIRFIRDDELLLPHGRLPWWEWQKQINAQIDVGSRVVYRGRIHFFSEDKLRERTNYAVSCSSWPERGIYTVLPGLYKRDEGLHFRFIYNPGDQPWGRRDCWDDSPRKRGIGFHFYMDEVLNYDQIDLADIEFYIHCRTEREHYLDMLPLLYELRKQRLAELEHEKGLVAMLAGKLKVPEHTMWDAISWWKLKNKWKRSISSDDAKAVRMITRRIKKS